MANPIQEHEDLLRPHQFVLVSQSKHRKYKDPEGRVHIVGKLRDELVVTNMTVEGHEPPLAQVATSREAQ